MLEHSGILWSIFKEAPADPETFQHLEKMLQLQLAMPWQKRSRLQFKGAKVGSYPGFMVFR